MQPQLDVHTASDVLGIPEARMEIGGAEVVLTLSNALYSRKPK